MPGQVAVQVVGVGGAPVVGVAVSFTVVQGGGIVTPDPVLTDGSGIARMPWILGPLPGSNTVKATAAGLGTVYFNATGL